MPFIDADMYGLNVLNHYELQKGDALVIFQHNDKAEHKNSSQMIPKLFMEKDSCLKLFIWCSLLIIAYFITVILFQ